MWAKLKIEPSSGNDRRGFTIVELLIVIVVIGILAAIVIVAYNGVQQRARNTQAVTGVNAYVKAIIQYSVTMGTYPLPGVNACLGANYAEDQCWKGDQGNIFVSATVDNAFAEFVGGQKPTLATNRFSIGIGNNMRDGAVYRTIGGPPAIIYYQQGINQPCGIAGATGGNEGGAVTQCIYTFPTI
jgi:prepilin-type N-terminal cleavage/methylation domain-containing protein